jgi:hypothetical protein
MQLEGELGEIVEKSFKRFVKLLDDHLKKHLFIFGERPSIADFAIAGQLIQMLKDPTPAKIIEKDGPFIAKWCEFMTAPTASGPFAALEDLKETLAPIFADDLAVFFLPWAAENLESSLAGAETFNVTLGKDGATLVPLRSSARSFRELRRKFVTAQEVEALKAFTDETASTIFLLRPQRVDTRPPRDTVEEPAAAGEALETEARPDEDAAADAPIAADGEDGARRRKRRRRRRGGRGREGAAAGSDTASDDDGDTGDTGADDGGESVEAESADGSGEDSGDDAGDRED